jgi:type II secretory pathway pseudopilin PulG
MVLVAIVVVGILAEVATLVSTRLVKTEREAELLYRGQAYRNAIRSYYDAGATVTTYPRNLEDLLSDPRFPNRHHLRALYPDPMVRDDSKAWQPIRALDGGISGVASRSTEEPLKKTNFPPGFERFSGARSYSEWWFEYAPAGTLPIRQFPSDQAGTR